MFLQYFFKKVYISLEDAAGVCFCNTFSEKVFMDKIIKNTPDAQVVIIGGCDGFLDEAFIKYIQLYSWDSLWVEPIPYLCNKLKENLKTLNIKIENSCISENQTETMIYVPENGPRHLIGQSSIIPVKNKNQSILKAVYNTITVPGITLENLFQKHSIKKIDYISIDVSGYEYSIFKQFDIKKWQPQIIKFNPVSLSISQRKEIDDMLIDYYHETAQDSDIIAIRKDNNYKTRTNLYILTYNSPDQLQLLLDSLEPDFLTKTNKYLLDNSIDLTTTDKYLELCNKYSFQYIKKDNIGICGGRQFIAEHFAESNADYMLFFEDDMLMNKELKLCSNGFATYIPNLFDKIHEIMKKEKFHYLKLSYTEFYGDNGTQWAWYNVPEKVRNQYFSGISKNPPNTLFENIKTLNGVSYITGEIYYCNWPQIVSKEGNRIMFLNTKFAHPYEQTWMSFLFQEKKAGRFNPALLLASVISHNRVFHYDSKIRREN